MFLCERHISVSSEYVSVSVRAQQGCSSFGSGAGLGGGSVPIPVRVPVIRPSSGLERTKQGISNRFIRSIIAQSGIYAAA